MPVWVVEFLGALIRWALATLAGALVVRGVIPQGVADSVVTHGVPALLAWVLVLLPLALSWLQKWKARRVKLLALEMKPGTSEKELDAEARRSISKHVPPAVMLVALALALSAATIAASGCRSVTLPGSALDVTSADQAARCVVILGDTFEASMSILVELRAAGHISDAQWSEIDDAQRAVNTYGPQLVTAVELWRRFGVRANFDASYEEMKHAVDRVARVQAEVIR